MMHLICLVFAIWLMARGLNMLLGNASDRIDQRMYELERSREEHRRRYGSGF